MGAKLEKVGGFLVGLVLFVVGFSLLQPAEGIVQTGVTTALAAVLTALGIGVIAAAALPHAIEVSGEKFKPLGLDVKASGGAAVFLVTLGFIYYMKDEQGAQRPPVEQTEQVAREDQRAPAEEPQQEASAAADQPQAIPSPAAERLAGPNAAPTLQPAVTYQAWTYCSACCPAGPDTCDQIGFGEGASRELASAAAIEECAFNGGIPQTCAANVRFVSEDDLRD